MCQLPDRWLQAMTPSPEWDVELAEVGAKEDWIHDSSDYPTGRFLDYQSFGDSLFELVGEGVRCPGLIVLCSD